MEFKHMAEEYQIQMRAKTNLAWDNSIPGSRRWSFEGEQKQYWRWVKRFGSHVSCPQSVKVVKNELCWPFSKCELLLITWSIYTVFKLYKHMLAHQLVVMTAAFSLDPGALHSSSHYKRHRPIRSTMKCSWPCLQQRAQTSSIWNQFKTPTTQQRGKRWSKSDAFGWNVLSVTISI